MGNLIENHTQWLDHFRHLKMIAEEDLNISDEAIQKAMKDSKKYMDSVRDGRQGQYDDIIRQIQKLSKKVG